MTKTGLLLIITVCCMVGCIKDAPLNPEADIETFRIDPSQLTGDVVINQANRKIMLFLTPEAYDEGIAPVITLSANATVSPASGDSIHPKSNTVEYTVTSESGANKKVYTVEVVNVGTWDFAFETWAVNSSDKYEYPVEADNIELWTSGNPGVALAGVPKQPNAYPTRSTTDGYLGTKGAEMVTIKGTTLSELVGVHLFAGSLFIGNFNSSQALLNPLAATEFGEPYVGRPGRFTGYYKYAPGPSFQDEQANIIAGRQDNCSIYAVLYKGPDRLNATNIHTSDKVLATAVLQDGSAKADFTKFDIPFTYVPNWDSTATNLMLAIVASSSSEGDRYRGAIGSRLVVDSLSILPQ
ncbi:MAG: PCMD domain-containing protein [Agriterribacter sp.]